MKRHLPLIFVTVALLALAGSGYAAYRVSHADAADSPFSTATVTRTDLTRDVSFTGTVAAGTDADLSFERAGNVARVNVKVGQKVAVGTVLASLNAADAAAQVAQAQAAVETAQAGVDAAQARLNALNAGARPEDLAVSDAQISSAQTSLSEARKALADRIVEVYAKSDDAVRGKIDPLYADPLTDSPHLTFDPSDSRLASDLAWRRFLLEGVFAKWQASLAAPLSADAALFAASADTRANADTVSSFLADNALALDKATTGNNPGISQTTLDGYKTAVSTGRANITAALSSLAAAEEKIRAAESAVTLAQSQRALKASPAIAQDVAGQQAAVRQAQAQVRQAQASLQVAQAQLGKAVVRAPFAGTVAKVNVTVGEAVSPGVPAFSLLSNERFEIDALASENQIGSFGVDDAATVTLDAYGTDAGFAATVARIDPVPASKDGASGYPVVLRFGEDDSRLKVGLTANVHITGASANGVLTVPRGAVLTDTTGASVLRKTDGKFARTAVTVGITADGNTEITDGLSEGDVVADLSAGR